MPRYRVELTFSEEQLAAIDKARGEVARATWIKGRALEAGLVIQDSPLDSHKQPASPRASEPFGGPPAPTDGGDDPLVEDGPPLDLTAVHEALEESSKGSYVARPRYGPRKPRGKTFDPKAKP